MTSCYARAKYLSLALFLLLTLNEFRRVLQKSIGKDSFLVVNTLIFDELLLPSITICPGPGFRSPVPFTSKEAFDSNSFTMEEIFHESNLKDFANGTLFSIKKTFSMYYGLCFTLQKLTTEKVSDLSFQIVVNASIDYFYYLHEPWEDEWLFAAVYPYEVKMTLVDSNNSNGFSASDIIIQKEMIKKIPGKGGCNDITVEEFAKCRRNELEVKIKEANLSCKVAAMEFTNLATEKLDYCKTEEEALLIDKQIYEFAQEVQSGSKCGKQICTRSIYSSILNPFSNFVLGKELKQYGDGYFILWIYYSSLYVDENIEEYVFAFDNALVAIGGSMGLFLGWSCQSIVMFVISAFNRAFNNKSKSKSSNVIFVKNKPHPLKS